MDTKFVTTEGLELKVHAVSSQLLALVNTQTEKKYRDAGEPIDPPTYEVETVGGGKEIHQHAEDTLQTDEDREEWNRHIDAITRMEDERNSSRTHFIILEGLCTEFDPQGDWRTKQERYGLELPTDPIDLEYHYITTVLLKTPADLTNAIQAILGMTFDGIDPALLKASEESFRDLLRQKPEESEAK